MQLAMMARLPLSTAPLDGSALCSIRPKCSAPEPTLRFVLTTLFVQANDDVLGLSAGAIGVLTTNDAEVCKQVARAEAVGPLLQLLATSADTDVLETASFALANMSAFAEIDALLEFEAARARTLDITTTSVGPPARPVVRLSLRLSFVCTFAGSLLRFAHTRLLPSKRSVGSVRTAPIPAPACRPHCHRGTSPLL